MKLCTIDWCENKHCAKGYCEKHYRKFKKYGDPNYTKQKLVKQTPNGKYKTCNKCGEEKPLSTEYFHKNKSKKSGFISHCKVCKNKKGKKHYNGNREEILDRSKWYYEFNKEEILKRDKKYREENKDKIRRKNLRYERNNKEMIKEKRKKYKGRYKERIKRYQEENKDKISARRLEYERKRSKEDVSYRVKRNLRSRVINSLRGRNKSNSTTELVGCSIESLKQHLESQFTEGMSWDNYGFKGWHIDHIRPCSSFDLTDEKQQRECFHYTNLQPLWAEDNLRKSNKINYVKEPS